MWRRTRCPSRSGIGGVRIDTRQRIRTSPTRIEIAVCPQPEMCYKAAHKVRHHPDRRSRFLRRAACLGGDPHRSLSRDTAGEAGGVSRRHPAVTDRVAGRAASLRNDGQGERTGASELGHSDLVDVRDAIDLEQFAPARGIRCCRSTTGRAGPLESIARRPRSGGPSFSPDQPKQPEP